MQRRHDLDQLGADLDALRLVVLDRAAGASVDWRGFTRRWFDRELAGISADLAAAGRAARTDAAQHP